MPIGPSRRSRLTARSCAARALVAAGLLAATVVTTQVPQSPALSGGTDWAFPGEPGYLHSDLAESQTPAECEGVAGIPFGTDPGWVRVGGSPDPSTPFTKAEGQVLVESGIDYFAQQSFVTHTDNPGAHYSHDINAFLVPDPGYRHLLSTGSFEEGVANEHGKMEIEWERGGIPTSMFPANGDRMTVWGPHVWDCGHGDTWVTDSADHNTYRTEIHPPVGWVVYRQTADANGLPGNEEKRTRSPWKWYGDDDLRGSAETFPASGLLNTPSPATVADAFFSSFGGNIPEALNGCDTDDSDTSCMQENEWRQNLLQQDYSFFVPAPPKPPVSTSDPAGSVVLVWDVEDVCHTVPGSPGNPPEDDIEEAGEADDTAENIGNPTCGTIPTTIVPETDSYGRDGIRVTVEATDATYPGNGYIALAKRYKVTWDHVPTPANVARVYRVSFDKMRVWNDSESCAEDGEWILSLRADDQWIHPVRGHGDDGDAIWENGAVDDGLCDGGDIDYADYAIGEAVTVTMPAGQPINVWARGWELDPVANDFVPVINDFRSGAGSWSSRHGMSDEVDWELFYTITEIPIVRPTQGSLSIGNPTYGPNSDTGGDATRISGASILELTGSDASRLQFRYWPVGGTAPSGWLYDSTSPFRIDLKGSGAADGRYVVQYAPVSGGGIVGQRRVALLELDTTAPSLSVPPNLVVDATSAAGAVVSYATTASDNLPGAVDTVCDKPSGTFFPVRTVTTVSCTARDKVGNSTTKSFTIEVVSPFGYIPDFAVLSERWTRLGTNVVVESGNVGAFMSSTGPPEAPGIEVKVGNGTQLLNGTKIAAETVLLGDNAAVNDVFHVNGVVAGLNATYTPQIGYVPLFLGMPTVPSGPAVGGPARTISKDATLPPGSYGQLTIRPNVRLTLTGGEYSFTGIDVGSRSQLLSASTSVVHVAGRVVAGSMSAIQPTGAQPASNLRMYVKGADSPTTNQNAAVFGTDTTVVANIYATVGTLQFGQHSLAKGGFLGRQVDVGNDARLVLQNAFDYP